MARVFLAGLLSLLGLSGTAAGLTPNQVLVIYNSEAVDSEAVYQYYAAARPGVRGFDLDDATLGAGTISYAHYLAKIRNPLRAHLVANDLEEEVVVFVLTRGLPHRVQDLTAGNVGDSPTPAWNRINAGQATYASVDSELTLLWQDLEAGNSEGAMDSAADNNVLNPYYNDSNAITSYSRSSVTATKKFIQVTGPRWQMRDKQNGPVSTPGSMCLTARLDGDSLAAVQGLIDRGLGACYDSSTDYIIQDKDVTNSSIDSGDMNLASLYLQSGWPAFTFEQTNTFLIGQTGNLNAGNAGTQRFTGRVAALTGYGGNHSGGSKAGFMATYQDQLAVGAIYNGYESFNAKRFGGVGGYSDHGQLSEWVNVGGTFGVGSAWEPLASGIPRNSALLRNYFLEGRTWVEAAWSSSYYLSWQMVVLGDPLAVASFNCPPAASLEAVGSLCETSGSQTTVTINLTEPCPVATNVHLSFSGAEYPGDVTISNVSGGMVTVLANSSSASFVVEALPDALAEGTEMLEISLMPGAGYIVAGGAVVLSIEDSDFGEWQLAEFGAEANTADALAEADPDGDGFLNLVEYAFSLNPLLGDGGDLVEVVADGAGTCTVSYVADLTKTGVSYTLESSTDGVLWNDLAVGVSSSTPDAETRQAVRTTGLAVREFYRVRVDQLP